MPLYEYECQKCGHRHERIEKFSGPHLRKCPDCGGKVEQMITSPTFQFKGSGWYVTEYGNKSSSSESGKAAKSEAKEGKEAKETKEAKDKKDSKESKSAKESKSDSPVKDSKPARKN